MAAPPAKKAENLAPAEAAPKTGAVLETKPEGTTEPIQFRIPSPIKRDFKAYAASRGIAGNKLFTEMYEFYRQHKG